MKTFVDTGGWLAVVVQTDQYHDVGVLHYEALINRRERLFTSDYVLDETVTRIRYDASHSTAVAFLDLIGAAERSGSLHILHVDNMVWRAAESLFRQYHDQDFSFTDCTSFLLAQQADVDEVFGFDHHFLMFGFNVRPLW
jgi:uncharacterized protein